MQNPTTNLDLASWLQGFGKKFVLVPDNERSIEIQEVQGKPWLNNFKITHKPLQLEAKRLPDLDVWYYIGVNGDTVYYRRATEIEAEGLNAHARNSGEN